MEYIKNKELLKNLDRIHMDISEMAIVHLGTDWKAENVRSVFTRVYMIKDGNAKISYNGKTINMLPGNIYVIPAELVFSYGCDEYMEKIYFHLSVLLPNHYDVFNGVTECIEIHSQQKLIDNIFQMMNENKTGCVIGIKAALYDILLKCILSEKKMNKKIGSYSELVNRTQEYIESNLSASLTVSQVAREMFLSPSKLQKIFKKEIGVSVGRYIDDRLMYVAELELRRGEKSINEISDMLGFCDQFYFSRRFSQTYGIPPIKYRKTFTS